jgi:predicted porin
MKKSLIALAVAGAFVAPAAMADTANVTIYGNANVSFDVVRSGDATHPTLAGTSTNQVTSNQSLIGLKGAEDLGGGTSAIFQVESWVNLDGNSTGTPSAAGNGLLASGDNNFAGLKGDSWGTLLLGQHASPYNMATRNMDLFGGTIADNRNIMGNGALGFGFDSAPNNVVAYVTPAMSGFTAAVAYVAGAELAVTTPQTKGSAWSLAGMYGAGPINASVAYQTVTFGDAPGTLTGPVNDKAKAWKVGGGYSVDQAAVNLVYERLTYDQATPSQSADETNWYLSGKYNVTASDTIKAAYTHAGTVTNPPAPVDTDAKQYSIGYDHAMSKRTTVYALYTRLNNNGSATSHAAYALFSGDGVDSNTGNTGFGSNPSAFSIGMKHAF